jgi:probable F420-dependent oxidoreductase
MKLGLYGINMGACIDPATAVRVATAAEAAGLDSLWTAEHVVLPDPRTPESPVPASTALLDPAVALAHVAGHTSTIRLATGIIILPQRNPVVLAKELASLDVLSGGRLVFGLGAGYIPKEFAACGIPFEERGARTDEAIAVLRDLWTSAKPGFDGRFYRYAEVDAHPRPVQRPHPPIVVGGMSPPAFRRAVRDGDGWYGFALDPAATARCLDGLRAAADAVERPEALGRLEITITPPPAPLDRDAVARYAELGVDRLVPIGMGADADALVDFVGRAAAAAL